MRTVEDKINKRDGELECYRCETPMLLISEIHDLKSERMGHGDIWFCPECFKLVVLSEYGELIKRKGKGWAYVQLDELR